MIITEDLHLTETLDITEPTMLVGSARITGQGRYAGLPDIRLHPGGELTINSFNGGGCSRLFVERLRGAGPVSLRRVSLSEIRHLSILNHDPANSPLRLAPESAGRGGLYFSRIEFVRVTQPREATAPAIDLSGATYARMNDVTLGRITVFAGDGPALALGGARPHQSVTVNEINGELITGQLIRATNMQGLRIERPVIYDTNGTTFTLPLIELHNCEGTRIAGYDRRDGDLAAGVADIEFTGTSRNNHVDGLGDRGHNPIRYGQTVDWHNTTGMHTGIGESHIALNANNVHLFGAGWSRPAAGAVPARYRR